MRQNEQDLLETCLGEAGGSEVNSRGVERSKISDFFISAGFLRLGVDLRFLINYV